MKLTIIGAGPGGYETAIYAVKQGIAVTLINGGMLGGTCLNEGCIPTKTFCHYAGKADYVYAFQKKEQVVNHLRKGIEYLLKNVTVIHGRATLKDSHIVLVNGITEVYSDYIIIATGSIPSKLNIPGIDLGNVFYSNDFLSMESLPRSICVIGGGVIGLEMASYLNAFGAKVSVLEYADEILPNLDKEIAKRLRILLSKRGIDFITSARVLEIDTDGVIYNQKGKEECIDSDAVLISVGRKPNTKDLWTESLGIEIGCRGILVDENMKTSVDNIYAIGDVNGRMMLAHVAAFQGKRAINSILGRTDRIKFELTPSIIYTTPEVASVGLSEEQCEDQELNYRVVKTNFLANGKAITMNEPDGLCKIIVDNNTNKILGSHIMGIHASDLIAEVTALMNMDATIDDMQQIIHPHPSLCEIFQETINK